MLSLYLMVRLHYPTEKASSSLHLSEVWYKLEQKSQWMYSTWGCVGSDPHSHMTQITCAPKVFYVWDLPIPIQYSTFLAQGHCAHPAESIRNATLLHHCQKQIELFYQLMVSYSTLTMLTFTWLNVVSSIAVSSSQNL